MPRAMFGVLLIALTACATPKLVSFPRWNPDKKQWIEQSISEIHFKAPKELKRVDYSPAETVALCLSAYTTDSLRFVPSEAVHIRLYSKIKSVEELRGFARNTPIEFKRVKAPIDGYSFWLPAGHSNSDNSTNFRNDPHVSKVHWGYAFESKSGRVCEVYISKWCKKPFNAIVITELVSPEEMNLVGEIARSIQE